MSCFSLLVIVIVIWVVVSSIKKSSPPNQKRNAGNRNNNRVYHTPATYQPNRTSRPDDILSRAKQNVEEVANDDDFMREKAARRERLQEQLRQRKNPEKGNGALPTESDQCWETVHEHDRVQENVEEILRDSNANMDEYTYIESGELMKKVEDLMVKGYEVNLPDQRDFLSEGMDMLNRYGM